MLSIGMHLAHWNCPDFGGCGELEAQRKVLCDYWSIGIGGGLLPDYVYLGSLRSEIMVWAKLPTSTTLYLWSPPCGPGQQYLMFNR